MKRDILFALIPIATVLLCCVVILTFNLTHDLYQHIGANKPSADILAAITAAAVVLAAAYIAIYNTIEDKP